MPGQFFSAYDTADLAVKAQMRGQDLDYAAQQQAAQAEQRAKFAKDLTEQITSGVKIIAETVDAHRVKGGQLGDPALQDLLSPIVAQTVEHAATARTFGYTGVPSEELVMQSIHNAVNAPSREEVAKVEGAAGAIKTTATTLAEGNATAQVARNNPDTQPRTTMWDPKAGRTVLASSVEAFNNGYEPLEGNWQQPNYKAVTLFNQATGESMRGIEDENSGTVMDANRQPLGGEWISMALGGVNAGVSDLTTASKSAAQEQQFNAMNAMGRLEAILQNLDAAEKKGVKFDLMERTKAGLLDKFEAIGLIDLTTGQQVLVEDQTKMEQLLRNNALYVIKEITGAAMGVQERAEIVATLPSVGQGVTKQKAAARGALHLARLAFRRAAYFEKHRAFQKWDSASGDEPPLSLTSFEQIMMDRKAAIVAEMREANPGEDPAKLNSMATRQIAEEFDYAR